MLLRSEAVSSAKRLTTSAAQMSTVVPKHVATRDLSIAYAYRAPAWGIDATLIDPSYADGRNHDWQATIRSAAVFQRKKP